MEIVGPLFFYILEAHNDKTRKNHRLGLHWHFDV